MAQVRTVTTTGVRYDEKRQFMLPQGVVARSLVDHPLVPRPKRDSRAAAFDELAGNTALGIHLSEIAPGGTKRGHRHVDEAVMLVLAGRGWSEFRQDDDRPMQRVEWSRGDVFAIPSNAWHQHFNHDPDNPARQLAFKDTRVLRRLFASRDFVYDNSFRFMDRYADEEDFWTRRVEHVDGAIETSVLRDLQAEPLRPDPRAGDGVFWRRYRMGGHRLLEIRLIEVAPGGSIAPHLQGDEEGLVALSGAARTRLWDGRGRHVTVSWSTGDLFCPPLHVWYLHESVGDEPLRLLAVRNVFLRLALRPSGTGLEAGDLDRFPDFIEPTREGVEALARGTL